MKQRQDIVSKGIAQKKSPAAPPVYRPNPTPLVLQRKTAVQGPAPHNPTAQAHRAPTPPPASRPLPAPKILQRKHSSATPPDSPTRKAAPTAYRPQPAAKVLQTKPKAPLRPSVPNNRNQMTYASHVIQRSEGTPPKNREEEEEIIEIVRPDRSVVPLRNRFGVYDRLLFPLGSLRGRTDMSTWSGGSEDLSGAHHIFPKAVISWLFDHLSGTQIQSLQRLLHLPSNSGAKALARLGSNLISAQPGLGGEVRPEARWDDPHHHRRNPPGEEFLDLIRTRGGNLELRSLIYLRLAQFVMLHLYPRYAENPDFVLTNQEAMVIFRMIMFAETFHYSVEEDPHAPSFHKTDFWQQREGRYEKGLAVFQRPLSDRQLLEGYEARKQEERRLNNERSRTRIEIVERFFKWLGREPESEKEDMLKCNFAGRHKIVVRYIHGPRRGQSVRPEHGLQYIDPHWLGKLKRFAETGVVNEEEMPWFEKLWK